MQVFFANGTADAPHVIVCIEGLGQLKSGETLHPVGKDSAWLLSAVERYTSSNQLGL